MRLQDRKGRILFLDWLRIIAFSTVLIGHRYLDIIRETIAASDTHPTVKVLLQLFFPLFQASGVCIFFLVSGYIITAVLQKERTVAFLVRRFFRLYPLYVVAVLLSTVYAARSSGNAAIDWWLVAKQMTLLGDFFQVPHSLAGVEWTLRIEVVFYLFMALCRAGGLIGGRLSGAFPGVLVIAVLYVIFLMSPFPREIWSAGFFNLYAPFLFVGSAYYLYEEKMVGATFVAFVTLVALIGYWTNLPKIAPLKVDDHEILYAFLVFYVFWLFRNRGMALPYWAFLLSESTYSVYLFHNWLYAPIESHVSGFRALHPFIHPASLLVLLAVCYLFTVAIERPAMRAGTIVSNKVDALLSSILRKATAVRT